MTALSIRAWCCARLVSRLSALLSRWSIVCTLESVTSRVAVSDLSRSGSRASSWLTVSPRPARAVPPWVSSWVIFVRVSVSRIESTCSSSIGMLVRPSAIVAPAGSAGAAELPGSMSTYLSPIRVKGRTRAVLSAWIGAYFLSMTMVTSTCPPEIGETSVTFPAWTPLIRTSWSLSRMSALLSSALTS